MIILRTSHRAIHKMINDVQSKITDEELFISDKFEAYLEDIAEVVSKRYKRPIKLRLFHNENDPFTAATDNRTITINTGNNVIGNVGNKYTKANVIIGLLGHELGHINFTDFYLMEVFKRKISRGSFYPKNPIPQNSTEKASLDEINELLKAKDEVATGVIISILCMLENILEDAYIELRMCNEFQGKLKKCIMMLRALSIDNTSSILEQIDAKYDRIAIVMNLILSYATSGRINNDGNYSGEYLDKLTECIIDIDNAIYSDDIKDRFNSSLQILLKIWNYVKEVIEKEKEKQSNQPNQQNGSSAGKSSKTKNEAKEQCDNMLSGQLVGQTIAPKGKGEAVSPSENGKVSAEEVEGDLSEVRKEIQQVVAEELGRLNNDESSPISNSNGTGNVTRDNNFAGSGYESIASDIDRVLRNIAEQVVNESEEDKLTKNIQAEADEINYGHIHRNVDLTIRRINPVPSYLKLEYEKVSPKLILLSKKLQKGIQNVIKDRKYGGKNNGLYMGKRIEARNLVRDDGKYFYKRNLPDTELDIAVAVLVDESGSMSSCDRITVARATSIILYDFCKSLNIPISILGHTSFGGEVELYSYADFNSIDGNDKYRIMDMCSRGCNRDGMALRYTAEKLMKRNESVKLLIIISDGQPSDSGYGGRNAELDLRQIKEEYTRKGITLFAAAIGDDKETIERIYKDGFLDISDLNKMPVNLIKLISRYVK